MSIYTRTGDAGQTSLAGGSRVGKATARIEVLGSLDEANCAIGAARVPVNDAEVNEALRLLQHRLFDCSALLARLPDESRPAPAGPSADDVATLERAIDAFSQAAGPLTGFVLPAGSETVVRLHQARAVLRRSERRLVALAADEPVDPRVLAFVNRASDLLFAAARYCARVEGSAEERWEPAAAPSENPAEA